MVLTVETFQQILSALGIPTDEGKEKRESTRVNVRFNEVIIPADGDLKGRQVQAAVHDLSCCGIGLDVTAKLHAGQRFIIQLPRQGEKLSALLCEVRHARFLGKNLYHLGAAFVQSL